MRCGYFDAGVCRSCTLMGQPYVDQLGWKQKQVEALLPTGVRWSEPVGSPESGFRNKAKMVVGGTVDAPTIGIMGTDLRHCGICSPGLRAVFPVLADFISRARVAPYDVAGRAGELKFLLLTEAVTGELMLRFVLRSREPLDRIRRHLPALLDEWPQFRVVSVNLQPEHKAVLEGDREILLHGPEALPMPVNDLTLYLRSRSFFQTNTEIAAVLYRQAFQWSGGARSVWDLYCGIGGFALSLARPGRSVVGVETSVEAVAGARRSAAEAGLEATFVAQDATAFALRRSDVPDLVVVNPPRRGLGDELSQWLQRSGVSRVLYSSCNAASLARDLEAMPALTPVRARVFDMFPQTTHYEVLVDLHRSPSPR